MAKQIWGENKQTTSTTKTLSWIKWGGIEQEILSFTHHYTTDILKSGGTYSEVN